jgi:hypothetical protein
MDTEGQDEDTRKKALKADGAAITRREGPYFLKWP